MGRLMDARPEKFRYQNSNYVSNIAVYEVVDVSKCLQKREISRIDSMLEAGNVWDIETRNAMGDATTMFRLICEMESWSWNKIIRDGEEKYILRMMEYAKGVIQ